MPPINNLLPKNFEIMAKNEELSKTPVMIKQWPDCTDLWFKKDDKFERPKTYANLKLYTNDCLYGLSPEARVFTELWVDVQDEFLREFRYMAEIAKLNYSATMSIDSVEFNWSGYNDVIPAFISETIQRLVDMPTKDLS
mgnify:CR=1 FL=1